jgi:Fe2+ or Zn2+ uptake regulation protein
MTITIYTNTDETLTEDPTMYDVLDLFDPAAIIKAVNYQGKETTSDCWEQRHIEAMVTLGNYISDTYPSMYGQIKQIHSEFQTKQADV